MERLFNLNQSDMTVRVDTEGDDYRVRVADRSYRVKVMRNDDGVLTFAIDGRRVQAVVAADGARRWVSIDGVAYVLEPGTERRGKHRAGVGEDSLAAAMPGQVVAVYVTPGERVERGQKLALLEAMKMELQVTAPHAGRVRAVKVKQGEIVRRGQTLVELEGE
jgi:acetyl/propionyl-CoA carboxylase alpha subunit